MGLEDIIIHNTLAVLLHAALITYLYQMNKMGEYYFVSMNILCIYNIINMQFLLLGSYSSYASYAV